MESPSQSGLATQGFAPKFLIGAAGIEPAVSRSQTEGLAAWLHPDTQWGQRG